MWRSYHDTLHSHSFGHSALTCNSPILLPEGMTLALNENKTRLQARTSCGTSWALATLTDVMHPLTNAKCAPKKLSKLLTRDTRTSHILHMCRRNTIFCSAAIHYFYVHKGSSENNVLRTETVRVKHPQVHAFDIHKCGHPTTCLSTTGNSVPHNTTMLCMIGDHWEDATVAL